MTTDWVEWHKAYEDPNSEASKCRALVQEYIGYAFQEMPRDLPIANVISVCAGDSGDILPLLNESAPVNTRALLIENNADLVERARITVFERFLDSRANVRMADAGLTTSYVGFIPASLIVAAGVFGNITMSDAITTIEAYAKMLVPGGMLVWSNARDELDEDLAGNLRREFIKAGFTEVKMFSSPSWLVCLVRCRPLPPRLFNFYG